ncbi:MAG: hypothetical protein IPM20_12025 [Gammaproteobacteria bacterium]|nr:hypothetical protein [Gammaproteobacteria bacterium]
MNRKRVVVWGVGGMAMALTAVLWAGRDGVAAEGSLDERVRTLRTAPTGSIVSQEERERNYRSCLFSFLPRVGSDVAAEMLRDACRDEYLSPDSR